MTGDSQFFNFTEASAHCQKFGMNLAQIHSSEENLALKKTFLQMGWGSVNFPTYAEFYNSKRAWIGAKNANYWTDGRPICGKMFSNWQIGEPEEGEVGIDLMRYNGYWSAVDPSTEWRALCEIRCLD